ncbi:hypothetical protein TNCV_1551391 [Trichonephila clavipes]|nr:hypothetical protein TNCV_1551391 [Trichonephila clavipes]
MVSPAVQGQVPHPSIVPEFLRSTSCGMTSARGHGAIVYCLNSGSEDRQTGHHNETGGVMDRCVQMLDKELWRLGLDGSGVCVFWRIMANRTREVKRDFCDLPIRRNEGRVVNTPLVFKRVLFQEKKEREGRGDEKGERDHGYSPIYPFPMSNVVMILALPIECMSSFASSIEKSSDTLSELRALKSTQSRRLPSSLLAQTIGYAISALDSSIKSSRNSSSICSSTLICKDSGMRYTNDLLHSMFCFQRIR